MGAQGSRQASRAGECTSFIIYQLCESPASVSVDSVWAVLAVFFLLFGTEVAAFHRWYVFVL